MVQCNYVSIEGHAMGDAAIEQRFTLAAAALDAGQAAFDRHAFAFRFEGGTLQVHAGSPGHAFWSELEVAHASW
ncbi:MAG: hypothetical protein ABI650_11105 [Dokdonella sp.]